MVRDSAASSQQPCVLHVYGPRDPSFVAPSVLLPDALPVPLSRAPFAPPLVALPLPSSRELYARRGAALLRSQCTRAQMPGRRVASRRSATRAGSAALTFRR